MRKRFTSVYHSCFFCVVIWSDYPIPHNECYVVRPPKKTNRNLSVPFIYVTLFVVQSYGSTKAQLEFGDDMDGICDRYPSCPAYTMEDDP